MDIKDLGLTITYKRVDELRPYERNARKHSKKQLRQIAASIDGLGFINPIIIDKTVRILAGHGRVEAAKMLGLETVPTIQVEHLSEDQIRAYILADNKIAEAAGWDNAILAIELQHLNSIDFSFDIGITGFDDREIELIIGMPSEAKMEDEPVEVVNDQQIVTEEGDCWLLDKHCVMCGDATQLEDIEYLMDGDKAAMVFTDPPYNVDYASERKGSKHKAIANDALGVKFQAFLLLVCKNILTVTKGGIYICMSSAELPNLQKAFLEAGGHWSTFIIWAKNTFTLGRSDYQRQHEPILYGWVEGGKHYWCGDRNQGDVWFFDKPGKSDLHPTMKPVGLVMRAIRNSSEQGDIVLDCFLGSGTTLIAAERTKRICYGLELDPQYVDAAVTRWQRHTGRKAIHAGTKKLFDEVLEEKGVKNG